jgi:homoserine kinase
MTKDDTVSIRVPATTSNLGPGFDTLGLALGLHNEIVVRRTPQRGVLLTSPVAEQSRAGAVAMLEEAAKLFFRRSRQKAFGVEVSLAGDVPVARGLGSSVTARLGVAAALNVLSGAGLDRSGLLDLVAELEHHPDNAAPAIFGGFTASGMTGDHVRCFQCQVSNRVSFVTLIPKFEISTAEARKLVPASFSKSDTVHNLNRAALITAAFLSRQYARLAGLFDDRVHQPYREALIPALTKVIRAGERAGAVGGWLSGSGSTIICLALENAEKVARAMRRALPDAEVKILRAENRGFTVGTKGAQPWGGPSKRF